MSGVLPIFGTLKIQIVHKTYRLMPKVFAQN
jgi:hypothetical protein